MIMDLRGEHQLIGLQVLDESAQAVAHAFRAGSRLRVYIEAPTGHTGFFAFTPTPTAALNTVLHDRAHPSQLVVAVLAGQVAHAPLPACDTLRNQPCRPDPLATPHG